MDREPELHPSGIIPRSFAIAIPVCRANGTGRGIAIAIERSW